MSLATLGRNHNHGHVFGVRHFRKLFDELQPIPDWHIEVTTD